MLNVYTADVHHLRPWQGQTVQSTISKGRVMIEQNLHVHMSHVTCINHGIVKWTCHFTFNTPNITTLNSYFDNPDTCLWSVEPEIVQNCPDKIFKCSGILKIGQTLHITTRYICKLSTILLNCNACNQTQSRLATQFPFIYVYTSAGDITLSVFYIFS